MKHHSVCLSLFLRLIFFVVWAPVSAQNIERVPLTGVTVAAALAQSGLQVSPEQVQLPAALSSAGSSELSLSGTELMANGDLRVRMVCSRTRACQPFVALVHASPGRDEFSAFSSSQSQRRFSGTEPNRDDSCHVRAGQHAALQLAGAHMQITLPVLVIDSGSIGTQVRVSSLDHKQVFQATVVSATAVRGVLP